MGWYGHLDPTDVKAKKTQTSWHHIHICVCVCINAQKKSGMTYSQLLIQVAAGEAGILGKKELVTVSLFTSVFTFFSSMNTKFFNGVVNDTFCFLINLTL